MSEANQMKSLDEAIQDLVRKHALACNDLIEKQLVEAIRQAIACGDFQRHVCTSNSSQAVIYIPHAREAWLMGRIRELEAGLKLCGGCGRYIVTPITGDVGICICNNKEFWLDTPAAKEPPVR